MRAAWTIEVVGKIVMKQGSLTLFSLLREAKIAGEDC